jgi:membrane protein implicated in regulation of membrane protease activity
MDFDFLTWFGLAVLIALVVALLAQMPLWVWIIIILIIVGNNLK